jgi:hypothetical protein
MRNDTPAGLLVLVSSPSFTTLSHRDDGPLPTTRCCRRTPPLCPVRKQLLSSLLFISDTSREQGLPRRTAGATSTGVADVCEGFRRLCRPPRISNTIKNDSRRSGSTSGTLRRDPGLKTTSAVHETTRRSRSRISAPKRRASSGRDRGSTPVVPPGRRFQNAQTGASSRDVRQHQRTTVHPILH